MRGDQLARQWKLLQLLLKRNRGMRAAELADELETPVRNVYRDLEALQAAGFPLYTDPDGREAYWTLTEGFKAPQAIPFTTMELMAMEVVRKLASPLKGTLFEQACAEAFSKIRSTMTDGVCEYLDRYSGSFSSAGTPNHDYGQMAQLIRVLHDGLNNSQTVSFGYRAFSTGQDEERQVDPYGLYQHEGTLYLVGHSHLRDDLRLFTVDRMYHASLTEQTFQRPEDFDLAGYTDSAFGAFMGEPQKVVLRFGAHAARYIRERIWHHSQHVEGCAQDGCDLTLEVPISGEIEAWILSWAGDCQVIQPEKLKKRIHELHRQGMKSNH